MLGSLSNLLPKWLVQWLNLYVAPFLKVQLQVMVQALLRGVFDTVLFLSLPLTLSVGSQAIWNARYQLTIAQQEQIRRWASVAQIIAYQEDVPPVVPLVLWYKEGGLQAENPPNCEGIMGLYTAVHTGQVPCFPSGPIGASEVAQQLRMGARVFKEHCPEVSYTTTNPAVLKKCYLYYNAGPNTTLIPDHSAYVMNGFDAQHQDMVLTDSSGKQHRLTAIGAWPAHLIIQTLLAQTSEPIAPTTILGPLLLGQETVDRIWVATEEGKITLNGEAAESCRSAIVNDCFVAPHEDGDAKLRPDDSPLLIAPAQASELICDLLPGVELTPPRASIVLAPISGYMSRYTDAQGHLAIRIENDEWSIWITGLRSYTAPEGEVNPGKPIGVVGGAGSHTPGIRYVIYDKVSAGFVDPLSFIPAGHCPPAGTF